MRTHPHRLALAALTLALTGCSSTSHDASSTTTSTGPAASTSSSAPATAAMAPSQNQLGSPRASRTITYQGARLTLDVWPPATRDGAMLATVRLHVDSASPPVSISQLLADPDPTSQVRGLPDGIRVVDPAGKTEYLPSVDSAKIPQCSPALTGRQLNTDDTLYATCVYGAPSPQSSRLQLVVPNFGSFDVAP